MKFAAVIVSVMVLELCTRLCIVGKGVHVILKKLLLGNTLYISNAAIVRRRKYRDNQVVGIFDQDGLYLDTAWNTKLIQAMNRAAWALNVNINDVMRRLRPHPSQENLDLRQVCSSFASQFLHLDVVECIHSPWVCSLH